MKIKLDIYQRLHALEINLHNAGLSASAEQVKDAASAGCTSSEILNVCIDISKHINSSTLKAHEKRNGQKL